MWHEAFLKGLPVVLAEGPGGRVGPAVLEVYQLGPLVRGAVEGTLRVSILGQHVDELYKWLGDRGTLLESQLDGVVHALKAQGESLRCCAR
jgi:hypothetical protein